jgi:hypothetical protein
MGLTVACARCHDHKYDPIPTADYYSLYGVFQSSSERLVQIAGPETEDEAYAQFAAELAKRKTKLAETLAARRKDVADRNRSRVTDYLQAQLELEKYPYEGFDQILAKTDLIPLFVRRWEHHLQEAAKARDPIFAAWHAYAAIGAEEFTSRAAEVTQELAQRPAGEVHPLVAAKFVSPPASMTEVAARYGELFAGIDRQWQELSKAAAEKDESPASRLPEDAAETLRQVLYSPTGPCEVPDEPIVNIEYYFDSGSCDELWKAQNEVDNWILQGPPAAKHAAVLNDRDVPSTPRVFRRGNPANRGDEVPRQFVEVLAGPDRQPFEHGSGRLELAQAIIDPHNPLTARVIVNRVWMHHFGAGLVRTPSDFGTRAEPPSHPELLDWLASRFIEDGWSLKKLHRRIMLSQTYQQASRFEGTGDRVHPTAAGHSLSVPSPQHLAPSPSAVDPENRLLSRFNSRRLTFEELRDSLLAVTGKLDRTVGGRAGDMFSPNFTRRTLYGTIDRQFLPSTLRVFDFASPDLHVPERSDTTVPQQALFFLNHPLMVGHAKALAEATAEAASPKERIQAMFRRAYQRSATEPQVQAALTLVELAKEEGETKPSPGVAAWHYGYGKYDEESQRVTSFEPLPHFTGSAWQGGPNFPDSKLGWVQLTAAKRVIHFFPERRAVARRYVRSQAGAGPARRQPLAEHLHHRAQDRGRVSLAVQVSEVRRVGDRVSELFARTAEHIDDIAVIRSMYAQVPNHEPSLMLMNCGDSVQPRPSVGAWVLYGLGTENQNLPGFIAMCPGGLPIKDNENWQSAFLPGAYQGTYIDSQASGTSTS